ncbi:MAG: hypothetical protein GX129_10330 [Clostridiales bacterium]|jgi:serpin B|nr:hypothetical protein [Clostridiales bacterium]
MKTKLLLLVALVLALTSCSANMDTIKEDKSVVDIEANDKDTTDKVVYKSMSADWPVYEDVEKLVKAGNVILLGRVTDISFQVLDDRTGKPPSGETNEVDRSLYTIYDLDVITSYKGDPSDTTKIRVLGGLERMYLEEQLKVLEEEEQKDILIIKGKPNILIDETYLFVLYQYEESMPTLVNMEQGVYQIEDPLKKDWYSFVSAKEIISYFGEDKWEEFNAAKEVDFSVQEGNQYFALDIFKKLNEKDLEESIFISPLSISQALAMAYNGAEMTTKESMEEALGLGGLERELVNNSFRNLTLHLKNIDKSIELNIGNSIWIRDGEEIREEFIQTNKKNFNAVVESLDFSDDKAVDIINNWIDNATKGKITRMLEPPIRKEVLMYLINAIYFKGEWKEPFDSKRTYPSEFYAMDGETQTVNMMRKVNDSVLYTDNDEYKAVRLPYDNGNTSMYIILPSEGNDINEFINKMTTEKWDNIKKTVKERDDIVFRIPRFKLEYGTKSLKDSLISLGMEEAFSDHADFTGIREKVKISDVMHKALIEVNEEGSEAAAVTVVEVALTAESPMEPLTFIANRPFMFIINDDVMDTILFMGKVVSIDE